MNIEFIIVTLEVSKLLKFMLDKDPHSANIPVILVTLEVSMFPALKLDKDPQLSNILDILVTLEVSVFPALKLINPTEPKKVLLRVDHPIVPRFSTETILVLISMVIPGTEVPLILT